MLADRHRPLSVTGAHSQDLAMGSLPSDPSHFKSFISEIPFEGSRLTSPTHDNPSPLTQLQEFYPILVTGPAHTQREGTTSSECNRGGTLGASSEFHPPHPGSCQEKDVPARRVCKNEKLGTT